MRENMHTQKSNDLVLISTSSPILCGVYEEGECIQSFRYEDKTLVALTKLYQELKGRRIERIFYAKGPGSFTAIKLTHIFLQTLQITQGITLFSLDAFYFNDNSPIKAFGNQYFVKNEEGIVLQGFTSPVLRDFALPKRLNSEDFSIFNEPLYILPPL